MDRTAVTMRHKRLLTDISDDMDINSVEYGNFVEHMKVYVPRGMLSNKKTLLGKFDALTTKGFLKPGDYVVLRKICEESGNRALLDKIKEAESDIDALKNTTAARVTGPIQPTSRLATQETNAAKRPRKEADESDPLYYNNDQGHGYYDYKGKKGVLLILNSIENRRGTEKDVKQLKEFFGDSGLRFRIFDPRSHGTEDLTTEQLNILLHDIRDMLNSTLGKEYYCFLCVILSHGNQKGFKTKDGLKPIEEIRREFNNHNIPNFAGRPKVFFLQACRGDHTQDSTQVDEADGEQHATNDVSDDEDESDEMVNIPTDADTLLAFATTPGYKSFRRVTVGSWFVTECIRVFSKYHNKDHLEDMLITVRQNVAFGWTCKQDGGKQMPCVWSTLTKRLMLKTCDTS